ncbi:ABC transporter ATP-binding protein [Amycolatopsis sp. NPDC049253]|uniref:ABC transporter ATP-binding protein n=1 Tax=Amycolatopsis sp. NPDC049253 TaxID=3155274 RepID=UPI00342560E0
MSTALEVRDVSKSFRGVHALSEVEIDVAEGSIVGIIGPNGAGKTTFFNVIAGALRPDTGHVKLFGKDVSGMSPHRISRLGMARTFQLMRPFGSMTVRENVVAAALSRGGNHRSAHHHAHEVIEATGMAAWADMVSDSLHTAALKRLELARVLATRPRLLLLDEVLAGLVPAERAPVVDLLARLRESEGLTLVFVEHIMQAVMQLSDSVVVFDRGRVIASGEPAEVVADPTVVEAYLGQELPGA